MLRKHGGGPWSGSRSPLVWALVMEVLGPCRMYVDAWCGSGNALDIVFTMACRH